MRIPTVIIHCRSMASDPRRPLGAYSAMYAVAIAESAPMAKPIRVRAISSTETCQLNADSKAPTALRRPLVDDSTVEDMNPPTLTHPYAAEVAARPTRLAWRLKTSTFVGEIRESVGTRAWMRPRQISC